METLKHLFNQPVDQTHHDWFRQIAKELLSNYFIRTKLACYRFKEIEFYYYSDDHQDTTTYGHMKTPPTLERIRRHKLAQTKTLTWFFHYSGIDIVFGKENSPGGILIRTIVCIERDGKTVEGAAAEEFKGPMIVLLELMNQEWKVDGGNSIQVQLQRSGDTFEIGEIKEKSRVGLDKADPEKKQYNFYLL